MVDVPTGLTPVIYDGKNWKVANIENKWYDYNNQEWANAVILDNNKNKAVGDTLDLATDVKAMFVYIPRYSYTIGNTYGVQLEGGNTPSEWYTHPAFTFGGENYKEYR